MCYTTRPLWSPFMIFLCLFLQLLVKKSFICIKCSKDLSKYLFFVREETRGKQIN